MKDLKHKLPQIGIAALVLLNVAAIYPLIDIFLDDPLANLPQPLPPKGAGSIQIGQGEEGAGKVAVGIPPAGLRSWDPFVVKGAVPLPVPTDGESPDPVGLAPVPVEGIEIVGLVTLNGRRHALLSIATAERRHVQEVSVGSVVRGTDGVTVVSISANAVTFAKSGHENATVSIERSTGDWPAWYGSRESEEKRGSVEIKSGRRAGDEITVFER